MAVELNRRNGQNYSENIIDPLLLFNDGTWTIASGTGTATINRNTYYVGSGSLKIENNVPASDIVVTNSTQSTIIDTNNNYQLSWFVRKDITEEVRDGAVLIYKNAVLLDTQTFSVGSTVADDDIDNEWVRFQSTNEYSLLKSDEITFQFKLDGTTTTELTTFIFVDGLMLNANTRKNIFCPSYVLPKESISNTGTGWQSRVDTVNTQALTGATDNLISFSGTSEENGGLTLLNSNSKVTPINEGDSIAVDFSCTIVTPAGSDNYVTVKFIVNGVVYRAFTMLLLKGSGNDDEFSISMNLPVTSDFKANGGEVYINPNIGLDIKNRYISVVKTHNKK
jgi:hypothetical protein